MHLNKYNEMTEHAKQESTNEKQMKESKPQDHSGIKI